MFLKWFLIQIDEKMFIHNCVMDKESIFIDKNKVLRN